MDPKDVKDHKDNASIDDTFAEGTQEETARVVDHIAERQLCRKFDVRLMPVLAIMCTFRAIHQIIFPSSDIPPDLFNALDKGNLGNAQTAGLSDGMRTYPKTAIWTNNNRSQFQA